MSGKRQADSELNHENWNDEDPADEKEMGQFKAAAKDVLEKRVIRTARRKNPVAGEASKSVFSGFGGFNKAKPTSFEFLANLTNGSKNTNGSTSASTSETTSTPGLFTSKPSVPGSGLFGVQTSVTPLSSQSTLNSSFGSTAKTAPSALFSNTKVDSTNETQFKIPAVPSIVHKATTKPTTIAQATSDVIDVATNSVNDNKSLFSSTNSTLSKIQSEGTNTDMVSANDSKSLFSSTNSKLKMPPVSTNTAMVQTSVGITTTPAVTPVTPEKKTEDGDKSNEKKIKYFSKLKGLNESVSDWISKHVVQNPLCILSPIFKDYEKYLKEITEEYQSADKDTDNTMDIENSEAKTDKDQITKTASPFAINNTGSFTLTGNSSSDNTKTSSPFAIKNNAASSFTSNSSSGNTSTPFGISNSGASPIVSTLNQDTKMSTPFAMKNTGSSPLTSQSTKISSPFATNNNNSSPLKSQNTIAPFAITNAASSPLTRSNIKTSTPFGMNTGSSLLNDEDTMSTPFGINKNNTPFFNTSPSNTGSSRLTSPNIKTSMPFGMNPGSSPLNDENTMSTPFGISKNNTSSFNTSPSSATSRPSLFGVQNDVLSSPEKKQSSFAFGIMTSTTNTSSASTLSTGVSFGVTSSAGNANPSPFSLSPNVSTNQTSTAPFSFGTGKPFSFSPNTVQQPSGETAANNETNEDEPPKVEYTPVKEDNSVYEKKCKIFVKKDGNFVDKGVGTLYIKKIEGNVKHQLLVRANTNLGTVLLNLVLGEGVPTQRMGKNNVMLVCIPTPDAKPPPTPILIRVKTGEEADELLETLNKYKA